MRPLVYPQDPDVPFDTLTNLTSTQYISIHPFYLSVDSNSQVITIIHVCFYNRFRGVVMCLVRR